MFRFHNKPMKSLEYNGVIDRSPQFSVGFYKQRPRVTVIQESEARP